MSFVSVLLGILLCLDHGYTQGADAGHEWMKARPLKDLEKRLDRCGEEKERGHG